MLVGASHFIQQIFQAFFLTNCVQLSELVRTGRLDFMLLLPVNTRFLDFFAAGGPGRIRQRRFRRWRSWPMPRGNCTWSPAPAQIVGFLLLCAAGILIHYSLMFLLASVAFWTVRAQGIVWGYYSIFNIARYAGRGLPGFFRAFFTFAMPMLLVANVPVKLLLNRLESPREMLCCWAWVGFVFCSPNFSGVFPCATTPAPAPRRSFVTLTQRRHCQASAQRYGYGAKQRLGPGQGMRAFADDDQGESCQQNIAAKQIPAWNH